MHKVTVPKDHDDPNDHNHDHFDSATRHATVPRTRAIASAS
jgi:hypothetical protein